MKTFQVGDKVRVKEPSGRGGVAYPAGFPLHMTGKIYKIKEGFVLVDFGPVKTLFGSKHIRGGGKWKFKLTSLTSRPLKASVDLEKIRFKGAVYVLTKAWETMPHGTRAV